MSLAVILGLLVNNAFKLAIPYGKKATYQMLKDEILLKEIWEVTTCFPVFAWYRLSAPQWLRINLLPIVLHNFEK